MIRKFAVISFFIAQTELAWIALFTLTKLDMLEVLFGGLLLSIFVCANIFMGWRQAYILTTQKRRKGKRTKSQKRCFKIYDLSGQIIEEPIPGTDLVEVRNVIKTAKSHTAA